MTALPKCHRSLSHDYTAQQMLKTFVVYIHFALIVISVHATYHSVKVLPLLCRIPTCCIFLPYVNIYKGLWIPLRHRKKLSLYWAFRHWVSPGNWYSVDCCRSGSRVLKRGTPSLGFFAWLRHTMLVGSRGMLLWEVLNEVVHIPAI